MRREHAGGTGGGGGEVRAGEGSAEGADAQNRDRSARARVTAMAGNTAQDDAIEDRRSKAWDLRVRGKTYREIGAALGVSGKTAHQDCHAVLDRIKAETDDKAEHHREVSLARLDRLTGLLMPVAETLDIDALKARIVAGEDSETVLLMAGKAMDAIDRLDKLEKRRAALLGLDAPAKHEHDVNANVGPTTADAARLIREKFGQHAAKEEPPDAS